MSDELKPCPFCDDTNPIVQGQTDETLTLSQSAWVECETCGATGRGCYRVSDAIEAWNRRTDMALSALPAAPETKPSWICEKCGADRYKEQCKGNLLKCPMGGTAAEAK